MGIPTVLPRSVGSTTMYEPLPVGDHIRQRTLENKQSVDRVRAAVRRIELNE